MHTDGEANKPGKAQRTDYRDGRTDIYSYLLLNQTVVKVSGITHGNQVRSETTNI